MPNWKMICERAAVKTRQLERDVKIMKDAVRQKSFRMPKCQNYNNKKWKLQKKIFCHSQKPFYMVPRKFYTGKM